MKAIGAIFVVSLWRVLLVEPLPGVVIVPHGLGLHGDVRHDPLVLALVDRVHDEGQYEAESDQTSPYDERFTPLILVLRKKNLIF